MQLGREQRPVPRGVITRDAGSTIRRASRHALTVLLAFAAPLAAGLDQGLAARPGAPASEHGQARPAGFATDDLSSLGPVLAEALGPEYIARAEPTRVTLACITCAGAPIVDVLLGTQTDGTEGRVRSGETTMEMLDARCRSANETCRITGLDVQPAVGWQSKYSFGSSHGATAIIILDGQMLTVRAVADDAPAATAAIARLLPTIRARIVAQ